jgi:glycosyl transferase family 25
MNIDWSFFDKIYCINLKEREDRYSSSLAEFKKYSIPVEYYRVNRNKINPDLGCFNSHTRICKEALNKGYNNIIIFEDDIEATKHLNKEAIEKIVSFLKKAEWSIFYLGCFPWSFFSDTKKTSFNSIFKCKAFGAHAYAINKEYISYIAGLKWEGKSYDYYTGKDYHYCYLPSLFTQKATESNIPRIVNFVNSSSNLKQSLLRLNERYSMHIRIAFIKIVLFILLLILFYNKFKKHNL